jgi:hypothetical protein
MMIVGMAAKVVPTLRGVAPDTLPRLWLPFALVNLGCFLRVSLQIATDWHPAFFKWVGVSGMIEWTGFAIWGTHLVYVMLGWGRYGAVGSRDWGPAPTSFQGTEKVAAILDWYPQLSPVFVHHGFEGVLNPFLRSTVARSLSLQQACSLKGVDLPVMLRELHASLALRVVQSNLVETGTCSNDLPDRQEGYAHSEKI